MTNQQAATKAKKRWGNKFYVHNSGHMSSSEARTKARQTVIDARAEMKRIDEEITRRLNALDWYQELRAKRKEAQTQVRDTEGVAHHYRFSVGTTNSMFNSISGQGDTWEEAFAAADRG